MRLRWLYEESIIRNIYKAKKLTETQLIDILRSEHLYPDEAIIEVGTDLLEQSLISEELFDDEKYYLLTEQGNKFSNVIESFPNLSPYYEEIYVKTICNASLKEEVNFSESFYTNWAGNFLHPFGDDLFHAGKLDNSLFYCYLATQSEVFYWLSHSLLCGSYDVVLRELRTILEGLFPTFCLDVICPDMSLEDKLEEMRKREENYQNHGKKAFSSSGFSGWEAYYLLYRELCKYVHISRKVTGEKVSKVAQEGYGELTNPSFDRCLFLKCIEVWRKIAVLSAKLSIDLLDKLSIEKEQSGLDYFCILLLNKLSAPRNSWNTIVKSME